MKIGKRKILKDINFSCRKGHITGLIGPNGAGKTTIMKCILGLYPYHKASIILNGTDIKSSNILNVGIGALIENPSIYPFLTGTEHLVMYAKDKNCIEDIVQALKMQSFINKKSKDYSLGMKQKLGIAIALLDNPQLIILDEPMNGLDPSSTYLLRNLLLKLAKQGITILISSHILSELEKIIDDVVMINNGKVILNVSKNKLEQQSQSTLFLSTNHNDKALKVLLEQGFKAQESNGMIKAFNISSSNLNELLAVIINNDIRLLGLEHKENGLEDTLLKLIESENN
ncbi:ABC transporter, ATP-binding protein [Pediococcus damnosus]|nr:ABC transporter, ATP-binding protein [Pediococcus damnosus]